ncbi:hypothetical protein AAHB34_02790 [Paenarthrobacter ureafaciens]
MRGSTTWRTKATIDIALEISEWVGLKCHRSLAAKPTPTVIMARYTAPPDQMLFAGSSRAEATPVTRGPKASSQGAALRSRKVLAPAQMLNAPATTSTLPTGLAHT